MPGQPLLGHHTALERLAGELHLFLAAEERNPADLVQVQVETLTAFIDCTGDLRRPHRAALAACLYRHAVASSDSRPPHVYLQLNLGPPQVETREYSTLRCEKFNTLGKL